MTNDSFSSLAHLSHELDAPLKVSIKQLHQLMDEFSRKDFEYISYKDYQRILKTLGIIHRQLLGCSVVSSRMLTDGSKKARLDPASCQITDVIKDIISIIDKQLDQAIQFKLKLTTNLPAVALGHVECFQIINNLLMNAVEAMPAGGMILIKTTLDSNHRLVHVEIQDRGIGMSKEFLKTIFGPRRGAMGLAIVHALLNVSGGRISIKSSLKKGTKVLVSLPIV